MNKMQTLKMLAKRNGHKIVYCVRDRYNTFWDIALYGKSNKPVYCSDITTAIDYLNY